EAKGIDFGEPDYTIPSHLLTVGEIQLKQLEVEAGYTEFAAIKDTAPQTEEGQAELAKKAEALRKRIQSLIKAGARPNAAAMPDDKTVNNQASGDDAKFSDVSQLPDPSPEQDDFVRKMFTTDEDGTVVTAPEMDYLVHKYAALTTAQLGEILST